jgi:epoxyqueuosine reductase QueG
VSLTALRASLAEAGFNLVGTLPVEEYDARVPEVWRSARVAPGARGVVVVGNAGRTLWPRFRRSPEARLRKNPLDRYTRRVLHEVASALDPPAGVALYTDRRDERYLPLVALAERAGFGRPGRVGVLLHPTYGPWVSIRGLLYARAELPFREPDPFDPCTGCPAPCASACRGGVIGEAGVDFRGCFRTKLTNRGCRAACDARSACVIGREHAFSTEQIAHHSRIRWRPAMLRHAARVLIRR